MATTATLTSVPSTGTNNYSSNIDSSKHKIEGNIISPIARKSGQSPKQSPMKSSNKIDDDDGVTKTTSFNRSTPTFRIPKIARSNNSIPSPDQHQLSPRQMLIETNESIPSSPSQVSNTKTNSGLNRQLNDELNSQQGKRKVSLSQYKEHKRLKSIELIQSPLTDTDMRINTMEDIKNSPPPPMDDNPPTLFDIQPIVSPKIDATNKDTVMKSNLSEPGVKKIIKKKVIWADENNQTLVQTSFFEIDDSDKVDMHAFARTCATNMSIAQLEKLLEHDLRKRRGLQDITSLDNDDRQNLPPLPTLIRILLPDTMSSPVVKSQEYLVQEEREKTVLQALFIRSFLPDSPGEPDGDLLGNSIVERSEAKLIPLADNTSSSVPNKVSTTNNNNSPPTEISVVATNPVSTVAPSLSSFSFNNLSPEVAQIFAQATGNLTSATANNTLPTTVNTLINPSTPTAPTLALLRNLTPSSNLLTALLNASRINGMDITPHLLPTNPVGNLIPNLPLNFSLPPPSTHFPMNQLLVNALTLGLPPPPNMNTYRPPPMATTFNSNTNLETKPPSFAFVSSVNHQSSRFNNNNEHHISSSRENTRGHNYRRGSYNNRRDYYQNRNVFS